MSKIQLPNRSRRDFLATSSFWALGTGLTGTNLFAQDQDGEAKKPVLLQELTPEELELVESSTVAMDLENFFGSGKGYSCAESGLIVGLRYLEKPEELVWVAGGYGGGLGQQDLCGFLTGGFMAIGLAAGDLPLEKKEAKRQCREMTNSYWNAWTSMAPIHCKEIREGQTDFKVCRRLGKLASVELEKILAPIRELRRVAS